MRIIILVFASLCIFISPSQGVIIIEADLDKIYPPIHTQRACLQSNQQHIIIRGMDMPEDFSSYVPETRIIRFQMERNDLHTKSDASGNFRFQIILISAVCNGSLHEDFYRIYYEFPSCIIGSSNHITVSIKPTAIYKSVHEMRPSFQTNLNQSFYEDSYSGMMRSYLVPNPTYQIS